MSRVLNKKFAKNKSENESGPGVASIPSGWPDYEKEIEKYLEDLKKSIEIGNASFIYGKSITDTNQYINKAKQSATKESLFGGKDSIHGILQGIRNTAFMYTDQSIKTLRVISSKIQSIDSKIPELTESEDENKKAEDIQKVLIVDENNLKNFIDEVKTKFSDEVINQLNSVLNNVTKQYETLNANYYHTIETLSQINASNQDKLDEIKDAKIRIIVEGLKEKNIKGLIEFTKLNMDQLTSNIDSIDKFFNALQKLEGLKLKESVDNIKDLEPVLKEIKNSVVWISDVSKNINQENIDNISKLFNTVGDGSLYNIFIFLNDKMKVLKLDDKISNQLINSFTKLTSIIKSMSILFNKELLDSIDEMEKNSNRLNKIDSVFENISQVFGNIDNKGQLNEIISSINNIEKLKGNKVKEIETSLIGVSKIFGESLLMFGAFWPMFLLYNVTIGKIDYTKIFKNLSSMLIEVSGIPDVTDKLDNVKKSVKGVRSVLKSLYLMNLMALPFFKKDKTHFERTSKIFTHLKTLFETIVNIDNSVDASKQMSNIKSGITDINSVLELIRIMDLENQINKIGSFDNLQNLFVGSEGIYELFKKINTVKNDKIAAERINDILNTFIKINSIIDTIKKTKVTKSTEQILESIYNLFNDQSKKQTLQKSLKGIFESIKFMQLPDKDKLAKVADLTLDMGNIINLFDEISKKNIDCDKVIKMFDEYIKTIEEIYKKIDERFDNIIQTSNKVDQIREANKKIKDGLDDCTEMAVTTGSKESDIKSGNVSLQGLTDFMISAAVVMSIGALFMMLGGGKFAAAALEFGATLMVFEILVLTPVLVFSKHQTEVMKSINNMNGFIITCTVTLLIGALFMTLGGGNYVKNALAFGIVLSIFEFLVVAPFLAFYNHKSNVMKGLNEFSTFLFTCTIIMSIGALIMGHANGKFIKNALKFGLVLGLFEALVVAPFILFGLIKGEVFENADKFIGIVITCTTILLIGALFMSIKNGALVKGAVKFAATLMLFEMMVIAPFLLMNFLKDNVYSGMKLFSGIIVSSTIILMIGTLFMTFGGGKYVKEALAFTGLLMAFEVGVILPFLLFNFIKRQVDKGLIGFAAVIFVSTTILMMGALFMTLKNGEYAKGAVDFAKLLGLFIGGIGLIAVGLSKWLGKNEIVKMQEFGTFVLLSSISLMIGAYVVKNYGFWNTVGYAIILSGFVTIMASIALVVSAIVDNDAVKDMMAFGAFVMLSSLALITGAFFISQYGVDSVVQYAIILGLFTGAMSIVALIVGKAINEKGIAAMTMLGTFLLLASGSLIIGATYIKEYGCDSALKFMGLLALYVIGAVGVFALLEFLTPVIIVGIATGALLGVALLTLTTSLMLVNTLFLLDPGGKKLDKNLEVLNDNILGGRLPWTFTLLGALSFLIIPGSLAAAAMGASLLILGGSLTLVNIIMEHGKEIGNSIDTLNGILSWNLMFTYSILGLLYPLIIPGSISAAAIGVSMLILGASLKATHNIVKDIGEEAIKKDIDILSDAVQGIGGLSVVMIGLTVTLTLGLAGLVLFDNFVNTISSSILHMTHSVKEISKEGDMKPAIKQAVENLKAFIDIPSLVFDGKWLESLMSLNDLNKLKNFTKSMSEVMLTSANAVQSMASLKVPTKWDKDGNPIDYRQLNINDFTLAGLNTSMLLSTMAKTFGVVWNGGTIDIEGGKSVTIEPEKSLSKLYEKNDDAIKNIVDFGIKSGTLLKGMSEGISNIAKLQIPIAWNENGNPIGYRQLNINDFSKASEGVQLILGQMARSIFNTYINVGEAFKQYNNGKNIFDDMDKDGPFMRTFNASFKMSELIGTVGKAVGDIAKMQIPIEWDPKTGRVTQYETLTTKHFTDMGTGVSKILGAVFEAIANIYTADWANKDGKNIFDAVKSDAWYAGILGSKDASPFERVLGFSFTVSELIGNIGQNIKDLALLQIPEYTLRGNKLIVSGYKQLTPEDFNRMGKSVGKILTATLLEIGKIKINDTDIINNTLNAITPISQLISDTADGIVKLASGQVPVIDPKTGKVTSYKIIGKTEYEAAGIAIQEIITAIPKALTDDSNGKIKEVFKDEKFKDIMEGISSTSGLIASIADSIIKLGSAQIPIDWKDGKAIKWDKIDIKTARKNLQIILTQIITSTTDAIVKAYVQAQAEGLFPNDEENPGSGNSKFDIAIKGITGITKIISSITDSVIKLGTAQIPTKWDEKGNPTWYTTIKPNEIIKNIKDIFIGNEGKNDGILNVLVGVIKDNTSLFDQNLMNQTTNINTIITKIGTLIGSVSNLIVAMSSLNMPTGFDKEGNPTGYVKVTPAKVIAAKDNVVSMINSLLTIPSGITLSNENNGENQIKPEDIVTELTSIGPIIKTLTSQVDIINEFNKSYSKMKAGSIGHVSNILTQFNSLLEELTTLGIWSSMITYETIGMNIPNISLVITDTITNSTTVVEKFKENNLDKNKDLFDTNPNNKNSILVIVGNILSTYDTLATKLNLIKNSNNGIISFNATDIQKTLMPVYLTLINIFTQFSLLNNTIKNINVNNSENIINKISNISDFYSSIIKKIYELYHSIQSSKTLSDSFIPNTFLGLSDYLKNVSVVLSTMFIGVNDSYKAFYENVSNFENNISNITLQLSTSGNTITDSINKLKENIETLKSLYEEDINIGPITSESNIKKMSDDIGTFISTINTFNKESQDKATKLNNLTQSIYNNFTSQKVYGQAFDQNTKKLKNYIQTVNSVKIDNVNALTTFIKALNNFAYKFGNLDDLTDAIANKLVIVLNDLVAKLEESANTINTAQEMQKERKKAIESSIEKIKLLMENPISIKVSSDSETTTDDGQPTSGESTNTTPPKSNQGSSSSSTVVRSNNGDGSGNKIPSNKGSRESNPSGTPSNPVGD